jgi:hypothetical protein
MTQLIMNCLQRFRRYQATPDPGLSAAHGHEPAGAFHVRDGIQTSGNCTPFGRRLDEAWRIKIDYAIPVENYQSGHPARGR